MKKDSKQLLFERMHTIGGMPIKEGILDEEIDVTKQYIDSRNGKSYSGEQVAKWVNHFIKGGVIQKEKQDYINFFNAIGLDSKEYKKEREKRLSKKMSTNDMITLFDELIDKSITVWEKQNIYIAREKYYDKLKKIYWQVKNTPEFDIWLTKYRYDKDDLEDDTGSLNFAKLVGAM